MGLIEEILPGPVALDTAIFIYFMEEDQRFLSLVKPVFQAIDDGELQAATSALTLLEVLVVPYRAGNLPLAERYESLLTRSRGLRLVELERPILKTSAQLRARINLRTPDSIQVAAALSARCPTFLTNDRKLPFVPGLKVLQLRNYLTGR
jgi:predicted nucleic acid-binding protein